MIRLFARHPTAGNLLMILMILGGIVGVTQLNRQFFPEFGLDMVRIGVSWSGASAIDVEEGVIEVIEPEVRFLSGVDQMRSTAVEGAGTIRLEFEPGTDMQQARADVEAAVSRITTLPDDADEPTVTLVERYDTISRLVVAGPLPERALKELAKDVRDELLDRGIDRIDLTGARDEEIRVIVSPDALWRLDTTLEGIADTIEQRSQDVPAGDVESGGFARQPRALGAVETAEGVAELPIVADQAGARVRLGQVATVEEGFDDDQEVGRYRGQPAVELHVQRSTTTDALTIAAAVNAYVEDKRGQLPEEVILAVYDREASLIADRIDLLIRNGLTGLVLVLAVLFLFLNARVAFWVAAGIPIALLGMVFAMWVVGLTINMISLFAVILALGIIVDDAIVVGEHAATMRERGLDPIEAAEQGAQRMAAPVTSASLTTIASFLPILVIGGVIGQIVADIPKVIVAVLVASLVECFLVLPCHMRHALAGMTHANESAFRRRFNAGFDAFRHGPFRRVVAACLRWRYTTIAAALGALILAIGLIASGRVPFVFFDGPPGDTIFAQVELAPGSTRDQTANALDEIEAALTRAAERYTDDPSEVLVASFGTVGDGGDNEGSLRVELVPSDRREVSTFDVSKAWREELPPIPGAERLTVRAFRGGPPGRDLDIRLIGGRSTVELKEAAEEVKTLIGRLPGVAETEDNLAYGKEEILVRLNARGEALGFTTSDVGRQLRNTYQGRIAKRFARGDEEVEIVVKLDPTARAALDLDDVTLTSPEGRRVRLGEVATLDDARGFARIERENGRRQVAVQADLEEGTTLDQVRAALEDNGELQEIARAYDVEVSFEGRAEERRESFADLRLGVAIALSLIYIVLAWVFGSFTRPLAVMLIIPFGLIGAVLGHLLLGYNLSILSLIALLGLSGILVNDSIILVSTVDEKIREGLDAIEAAVEGAVARLRAVLLTSLTTILGLLPMLFETSLQARFLIPMVITLSFGLMVTTFLVLLLVPAMIGAQADAGRLVGRLRRSGSASPQPAE